MGIPKIKSATTFRSSLYKILKEVSKGDPQIVTHSQGSPVVLISQKKYNKLFDERESLHKIAVGTQELDAEKGIPHNQALKLLKKLKSRWK